MSLIRSYTPKQLCDQTHSMSVLLYQRTNMYQSKAYNASENFYLNMVLEMHEILRKDMQITLTFDEKDSILQKLSKSLMAIEQHFFGESEGPEYLGTVKECIDKTKSIQDKLYQPVSLCTFTQ